MKGRKAEAINMDLTIITLRNAVADDAQLLFEWRNDVATRQSSLTEAPIKWREHEDWFKKALSNSNRSIRIGQYDRTDIGMVRLDISADYTHCEISIMMAPEARGRGLAAALLSLAMHESPYPTRHFTATIKPSNAASKRIFERNGFRLWRENCLLKGELFLNGDWCEYSTTDY